MLTLTTGLAPTPSAAGPSSLLKLLAGEFALRIARLWPAPHAEFVTAPTARRHLLCLALSHGRDLAAVRETVLTRRIPRAIVEAVPNAPQGLARALPRLGEVAWPADGYRKLLMLLAEPKAAKVLRHADAVELETVLRVSDLPPPMSAAAPLALALNPDTVAAVREAYEALRFRSGAAVADATAARWAQAATGKALVEAVKADLYPEPAAPPHPGTARLRPLTSKAEFRSAARRFRNCLMDQTPYAGTGWSAYYEWLGSPGAVVEISRDVVFGWRLEQARLAGNAGVPEATRQEILSDLALMGVHVGRSGWELDRALNGAIRGAFGLRPLDEAVAEAFAVD